eukprot:scaffold179218_cov24-Tisochrysis_lutea.AAC.2
MGGASRGASSGHGDDVPLEFAAAFEHPDAAGAGDSRSAGAHCKNGGDERVGRSKSDGAAGSGCWKREATGGNVVGSCVRRGGASAGSSGGVGARSGASVGFASSWCSGGDALEGRPDGLPGVSGSLFSRPPLEGKATRSDGDGRAGERADGEWDSNSDAKSTGEGAERGGSPTAVHSLAAGRAAKSATNMRIAPPARSSAITRRRVRRAGFALPRSASSSPI